MFWELTSLCVLWLFFDIFLKSLHDIYLLKALTKTVWSRFHLSRDALWTQRIRFAPLSYTVAEIMLTYLRIRCSARWQSLLLSSRSTPAGALLGVCNLPSCLGACAHVCGPPATWRRRWGWGRGGARLLQRFKEGGHMRERIQGCEEI